MKYVIFSKLNKNHFFFLSYFIIAIIDEICNRYMKSTDDIAGTFHKNYIYSLSDLLSIIPFIIIKIRSRNTSNNELKNELTKENTQDLNKNIEYIYTGIKEEKKRNKQVLKLSIIVSLFDFFAININIIFKIIFAQDFLLVNRAELNSIILFCIISNYALSIFILHTPFYRHHYICMAINLIFLIALIVIDIINIVKGNLLYPYVVLRTIIAILYSFEDVFAKILLSINSISPYIYLLIRGIIVNLLTILYSFVFIFVELPDENGKKSIVFSRFWKLYEYKLNILFYLIKFFNGYFMKLNIFFIIDKFSVIHFAMASIIENYASILLSIIYGNIETEYFFIKFSIYFVLIITALVYNEFIVLNFCGLEKFTQIFLQKKAKKDFEQANINNINDNEVLPEGENIKENAENNESDIEENVSESNDSYII